MPRYNKSSELEQEFKKIFPGFSYPIDGTVVGGYPTIRCGKLYTLSVTTLRHHIEIHRIHYNLSHEILCNVGHDGIESVRLSKRRPNQTELFFPGDESKLSLYLLQYPHAVDIIPTRTELSSIGIYYSFLDGVR